MPLGPCSRYIDSRIPHQAAKFQADSCARRRWALRGAGPPNRPEFLCLTQNVDGEYSCFGVQRLLVGFPAIYIPVELLAFTIGCRVENRPEAS